MDCLKKVDYSSIVKVVFLFFIVFFLFVPFSYANYGSFSFQCLGAIDGDEVEVSFYVMSDSSTDVTLSTALEDRHSISDMAMRFYRMKSITEGDSVTIYYSVLNGGLADYFLVGCSKSTSNLFVYHSLMGLAGVLSAGFIWYGINQAFVG